MRVFTYILHGSKSIKKHSYTILWLLVIVDSVKYQKKKRQIFPLFPKTVQRRFPIKFKNENKVFLNFMPKISTNHSSILLNQWWNLFNFVEIWNFIIEIWSKLNWFFKSKKDLQDMHACAYSIEIMLNAIFAMHFL